MSDQCCNSNDPAPICENDLPLGFWHIREVQASSASCLLALFCFLAGWNDAPSTLELTFYIGAILIVGYTFFPETIKNLFKGNLAVGILLFFFWGAVGFLFCFFCFCFLFFFFFV